MAIDDNASYELTGAQVKDLANKIKAKAADNIFVGATSAAPGSKGLVPAPQAGDDTKYLKGDGTWGAVQAGPTDTTFYFNSSTSTVPASTVHVYKDQAMTQMANGGDIETAFKTGRVLVVDLYGNGDESGVIISLDTEDGSKLYFYMAGLGAQQQRLLAFADAVDTSPYYGIYNLQDRLTAGSNIQISGDTISATDTTYSAFGGATSSVAGSAGLVPAPAAGDEGKALHGDGTWKDTTAKLVEMSYGESNAWTKFINAYNAGSIVYCRASSNSDPGTGTQGRKAFMAYVNNATTPTEVEFQYVRSVSSKTDSQQGDQVFIYKLTNASGGTWTVATRNMSAKINVSGPITKTFTTGSNATVTIGANAMTGATSSAAGAAGVVPAPAAGDQGKFLSGAGTWVDMAGSYSTSEQVTPFTWIDGKPIYKKTVNFGALPNSTSKQVDHNISNLSEVVKIDGIATKPSIWTPFPLIFAGHDSAYNVSVEITTTKVSVVAHEDRSHYSAYVTIWYTKTTD